MVFLVAKNISDKIWMRSKRVSFKSRTFFLINSSINITRYSLYGKSIKRNLTRLIIFIYRLILFAHGMERATSKKLIRFKKKLKVNKCCALSSPL